MTWEIASRIGLDNGLGLGSPPLWVFSSGALPNEIIILWEKKIEHYMNIVQLNKTSLWYQICNVPCWTIHKQQAASRVVSALIFEQKN